MSDLPQQYRRSETAARITLIAQSFTRLLGRSLVEGQDDDTVMALWRAPCVIVAHGTEVDPVFFFGNRAALAAFECDAAFFVAMPSRLSAEAPDQAERQALLDRVKSLGYIDDYAGIRISATGKRFSIDRAIVWNLLDHAGVRHGQAATFTL